MHITGGYCWRTSFKVLEVLFLGEVSSAFLPSKKACWAHQFATWGLANSIRALFRMRGCSDTGQFAGFYLVLRSNNTKYQLALTCDGDYEGYHTIPERFKPILSHAECARAQRNFHFTKI